MTEEYYQRVANHIVERPDADEGLQAVRSGGAKGRVGLVPWSGDRDDVVHLLCGNFNAQLYEEQSELIASSRNRFQIDYQRNSPVSHVLDAWDAVRDKKDESNYRDVIYMHRYSASAAGVGIFWSKILGLPQSAKRSRQYVGGRNEHQPIFVSLTSNTAPKPAETGTMRWTSSSPRRHPVSSNGYDDAIIIKVT